MFFFAGFVLSDENTKDKKLTFMALPFAFYTSDTGFGGGFAFLKSYRSNPNKISSIQSAFMTTEKKQTTTVLKIEHFFKNNDRFLFESVYTKYPTVFFGIGNNTKKSFNEQYTPEYFKLNIYYEKRLVSNLKVKANFNLRNQSLIKQNKDGIFNTSNLNWKKGRFDTGPGIGILWDNRDNTLAATTGTLAKIEYSTMLYQNEGKPTYEINYDFRKFYNPLPGFVLAYMFWLSDTTGDTPYYLYPNIGGQERLRGYEEYRFMGKKAILFQHDLRFPVYGPLGGAAFIATGRVSDKTIDLFSGRYHTGYGMGLRYFVNKEDKLVFRFDWAFGKDTDGVYFTFSEAY
jgi:hypothetical protein